MEDLIKISIIQEEDWKYSCLYKHILDTNEGVINILFVKNYAIF